MKGQRKVSTGIKSKENLLERGFDTLLVHQFFIKGEIYHENG